MAEKKGREPERILKPDWLIDPAGEVGGVHGRSGGELNRSGGDSVRSGHVRRGDGDTGDSYTRDSRIRDTRVRGSGKTGRAGDNYEIGGRAEAGHTGSAAESGNKKKSRRLKDSDLSGRYRGGEAYRKSGQTRRTQSQFIIFTVSTILPLLRRLPSVLKHAVLSAKNKIAKGCGYLYRRASGHESGLVNDGHRQNGKLRQGSREGRSGNSDRNDRQGYKPGYRSSYTTSDGRSGRTSADISAYTREKKVQEEARIRARKLSEKSLDRREQQLRRHYVFLGIIFLLLILGVRGIVYRVNTARREQRMEQELEAERGGLSEAVLGYEETVKSYAKANGLTEYVDIFMAIMEVESKGLGNDVMQSSESMGLAAGSLEPEESISQACSYWARLLKIADSSSCDIRSVIQAYNFGPGYLTYVAENNGGKYSEETAIEFARQQSGGETVTYTNEIAVQKNGGWMYSYGNMFYEELVEQYLPEGWDAEYT